MGNVLALEEVTPTRTGVKLPMEADAAEMESKMYVA